MKVATAAEMRRIDRVAIEERGISGIDLMESAGWAIARAVMDHVEPGLVVVLAGSGNNAGDGFVAARRLVEAGYSAVVVPVMGSGALTGDAAIAWGHMPLDRVRVTPLPTEDAPLLDLLRDADALVDAMLGTGARLPLRTPVDRVVRVANASGTPIIAADIPTGLSADGVHQSEEEPVIRAALTVTIGLPKVGMLGARGVACCGHVRVEALQFPRDLLEDPDIRHATLTLEESARLLPPRPASGHKGTFGNVLVCGGSRFLPGAAILACHGALRSGAGMVRLHAPAPVMLAASCQLPEVMLSEAGASWSENLGPVTCCGSRDDCERGRDVCDLCALLESADVLVLGPGLGLHSESGEFLAQVMESFPGPMVLDADALKLLAGSEALKRLMSPRMVLTPHPGEMARLLGGGIASVQMDRWGAAQRCAEAFGATVVLKGFGPLVASPDTREILHVPAASTALSKGGSGDLLAGLIGGLLAQGLAPRQAAILGSFVGGLASDLLARDRSPRATIIRDVAEFLPAAFRKLEQTNAVQ